MEKHFETKDISGEYAFTVYVIVTNDLKNLVRCTDKNIKLLRFGETKDREFESLVGDNGENNIFSI